MSVWLFPLLLVCGCWLMVGFVGLLVGRSVGFHRLSLFGGCSCCCGCGGCGCCCGGGGGVDAQQAQDHSLDQVQEGVRVLLLRTLRRPAPKQPRLLQVEFLNLYMDAVTVSVRRNIQRRRII